MKKKTFILLIVLMPFISKGQVFSSLGGGYDLNGRAIATLAVGYNYSILNFQGEIRPSVSRNVVAHNYMGFRLSFNVINPDDAGLSILPGIGYYYDRMSADKKKLNKSYFGTSIKSSIEVTEDGALFIEALYINNSAQFQIGMIVNFHKQRHLY